MVTHLRAPCVLANTFLVILVPMQNSKQNRTGEDPASNVYPGKGRQKHWVLRRYNPASHGAINPVIQDDAIHLHLEGDFCMSGTQKLLGGSERPHVLVCRQLPEETVEQISIAHPTKLDS